MSLVRKQLRNWRFHLLYLCFSFRPDAPHEMSLSFAHSRSAKRSPHALITETSNSIFRLSPTRNPPVSSAAFQGRQKSRRLILVVAEAPMLAFAQGSFVSGDGTSPFRTPSRVTPWIVRSPCKFSSPSPSKVTVLLLKVIAGYFSTSRKSALFRCLSRSASRVLIVFASITTSTLEVVGFSGSYTTAPCTPLNPPRTFVIIMWRTTNCAVECAGSIL